MIGFARELAAVMTAVVVSARTGAAIAAELATMKVQEEVDALRGMGINVSQYLVVPKVLALVVVLPCLATLGLISGVFGGAVWGVVVLGFRPSIWYQQTLGSAYMEDVIQGMLKTIFFAIAIAMIGCHNGLRVTGGSRGVGLMTTRAVVMDIFMLICIDIVFAAIFYYLWDNALMEDVIIQVKDLVAHYGNFKVLDGVSFEVKRGEIFMIVGGGGCAKHPAQAFVRLDAPTSGTILFEGRNVAAMDDDELAQMQHSIGIAFQSAAFSTL